MWFKIMLWSQVQSLVSWFSKWPQSKSNFEVTSWWEWLVKSLISQKIRESPDDARYRELKGQNLTPWTFELCLCRVFTIGLSFPLALLKSRTLTNVSSEPVAIKLLLRGLQSTVLISDLCTSLSLTTGEFPCLRSHMISYLSTPTLQRMSSEPGIKHRSSTLYSCPTSLLYFSKQVYFLFSGFGSFK